MQIGSSSKYTYINRDPDPGGINFLDPDPGPDAGLDGPAGLYIQEIPAVCVLLYLPSISFPQLSSVTFILSSLSLKSKLCKQMSHAEKAML